MSAGINMAFREYGSYDGMGLAELVRKKQVTPRELLDEAIARTAKVDPQINAVVVKHYDYAERQIDQGTSGWSLHRRAVSAEGSRYPRGHADDLRREHLQGRCRRPYRHPRPALPQGRRHDLRQKRQSGIRIDADHRVRACSVRPAIPGISRTPPVVRPAARLRPSPRAFFPSRMPAMAAVRYGFRRPHPACSD